MGKGGVAILEPSKLRGTVDRGGKRSRLGCFTIRKIARIGRRACCASNIQTWRRNFRQYCDSVAASIGAHSPGMVSVGKPARFTPIREWGALPPKKNTPPTPRPTAGRIIGPIPAPAKWLSSRLTIQFLEMGDSSGAPSFPLDKWKLNHAWGVKF